MQVEAAHRIIHFNISNPSLNHLEKRSGFISSVPRYSQTHATNLLEARVALLTAKSVLFLQLSHSAWDKWDCLGSRYMRTIY